ncbi:MAG TPA: DUF2784 domain-containing protein [Vicinamibacterales bacterium]|nr:DUF2784 domain-containing protein [Vicinamibacterales bacterium]
MEHVFAALAAGVVLAHVAFVVFAVLGGFLATARPWVALLHLPCVAWAAWVEFSGTICPLTPLEQALRVRAGLAPYAGDFIARYVFPLLYPEGLTRQAQIALGMVVLAVNLIAYGRVLQRRWRSGRAT